MRINTGNRPEMRMNKLLQLLKIEFFSMLFVILGWLVPAFGLGPEPGDIYREYRKGLKTGDNWRVTHPRAGASGAKEFLPNPELKIEIEDLEGAVRAEVVIDRWGGHPGTSNKRVRFNGNDWIALPELTTVPEGSNPTCYMYQDNPVFEVPLEHLKEGTNTFEGTCGGQTCFSFDWGQWGWYGIIIRVYYDSTKAHPGGWIISPAEGGEIRENPTITAEAFSDAGISMVEFLAYYEGYDLDGDGIYLQWHRRYKATSFSNLLGVASKEPYQVTWKTRWVPDQQPGAVKLMARIRDNNGYWFVTDAVEGLSLKRDTSAVRLYKAYAVPRRFWVRAGRKMFCRIDIPETESLGLATGAAVHIRTWNGIGERFGLNEDYSGSIGGANHMYQYSIREVPLSALVHGRNTVFFKSSTEHHGVEILWPGPGLTVRYRVYADSLATCDFNGDGAVELADLIAFLLLAHRYPHDPRVDWTGDGRYEINDAIALLRDILQDNCPNQGAALAAVSTRGGRQAPGFPSAGELEYLERSLQSLPLNREQQAALKQVLRDLALKVAGSPGAVALKQNAPNPFNPVTTIVFSLPQGAPVRVRLSIYDLRGRRLRTLLDEIREPGEHAVFWDGKDRQGRDLPNGVYLYRLEAAERIITRKMVLLK